MGVTGRKAGTKEWPMMNDATGTEADSRAMCLSEISGMHADCTCFHGESGSEVLTGSCTFSQTNFSIENTEYTCHGFVARYR